jgi:hypothetical protein
MEELVDVFLVLEVVAAIVWIGIELYVKFVWWGIKILDLLTFVGVTPDLLHVSCVTEFLARHIEHV